MEPLKYVVLIALVAILFSLGKALFHLNRGGADSSRTLRALTWRIVLSICLLGFLVFAARQGWIAPHGLSH